MVSKTPTPVFFNDLQLEFKPRYEWAFGEKITHPETTARAESILAAVSREADLFDLRKPAKIPLADLRSLHSYHLVTLYSAAQQIPEDLDFHPTVFLQGKRGKGDPTNLHHAGAYCFDSGTPLNSMTLDAASWSAACAKEAAMAVKRGARFAYALSRPPGHHAQRDLYGGYCYFNNSAVAARYLRRYGRVVVLDVDFHHGNGTQDIFYRDGKVLTISIHGDPREFFPFFTGYAMETGEGEGAGFNLNIPLPTGLDGQGYFEAFEAHVVPAITHFDPQFIVLATGLDTYERDPIGGFKLSTDDLYRVGELVGGLQRPLVAVQEGGYYTAHLGRNAVAVLRGLRAGLGIDV